MDDRLYCTGGQWRAAAVPPGKAEYTSLIYYLNRKLSQLGVEIKLNTPLTREIVEAEKPDTVILATGGVPSLPPIKGLKTSPIVHPAVDVLLGKVYFGKNIVVVGGGIEIPVLNQYEEALKCQEKMVCSSLHRHTTPC